MFLDGLNYAAIAHNLANGHGSFWQPYFSATHDAQFYSHPPLALGMESLFFQWFGDSYLIEKAYSVLTYLVDGLFIVLLWHEAGYRKTTGWIPLLLWLSFPLVTWAAPNNLLENTMTVFILAGAFCYLKSNKQHRIILLLISSLLWLGAILCKGPTALFLPAFPIFIRLLDKNISWKHLCTDLLLLVGGLLVCIILLFLIQPAAYKYFIHYYKTQLVVSFTITPTNGSHFYILKSWLGQMAVPLIITTLSTLIQYFRKHKIDFFANGNHDKLRLSIAFLLTGLCGVLPIMISAKQHDFYMLSALPFFAIGLGMFVEVAVHKVITKPLGKGIGYMHTSAIVICVIAVFLNVSQYGKYGRDEVMMKEIERTMPYLQEGAVVNMSFAFANEWNVYGYYARIKDISLKVSKINGTYYLFDHPTLPDSNYIGLTPENKTIFLFRRK